MQTLICSRVFFSGYYTHISTLADVQENVMEYLHVLSRPMVINHDHDIIWTEAYMDTVVSLPGQSKGLKKPLNIFTVYTTILFKSLWRAHLNQNNVIIVMCVFSPRLHEPIIPWSSGPSSPSPQQLPNTEEVKKKKKRSCSFRLIVSSSSVGLVWSSYRFYHQYITWSLFLAFLLSEDPKDQHKVQLFKLQWFRAAETQLTNTTTHLCEDIWELHGHVWISGFRPCSSSCATGEAFQIAISCHAWAWNAL